MTSLENVFNGIVLNDLSGHMPILACFHKELNPYCQGKVFKRSFNESNMNQFRQCLSQINWCTKLNPTNVNDSYNIFLNEYVNLFDTCFPIERIKPILPNPRVGHLAKQMNEILSTLCHK